MSVTFEKVKELIIEQIDDPINPNGKFIYFMASPDNDLIKIGISNNPHNRRKTVNTSVPFNVELLTFFPDNGFFEKILHEHFDEQKYKGYGNEWFFTNKELNILINLVRSKENKLPKFKNDKQISLKLPESKYTLLEELKKIDDKSINSLVVEAITLLIQSRKEDIKSQLHNRTDKVTDALSRIE